MARDQPKTGQPEPSEPTTHMSATVHDQGAANQAGNNQYITNNNYFGGAAPGPASPSSSQDAADGGDGAAEEGWLRAHRKEWILALGGVVAAAITAAATYAAATGDSDKGTGSTPSSSLTSGPATGSQSGKGESGGSSPSTGSKGEEASQTSSISPVSPGVQWQGPLLLDGGAKDLDKGQPVDATGRNDVGTGGISVPYDVFALDDGSLSSWEGDRKVPNYADCAKTVDSTGTHSVSVDLGSVVCLKTDEGRVARLKVTQFPEASGPVVKFDAVVWDLAAEADG